MPPTHGTALTFPPAAAEPLSTQYTVSVNGQNAPVYTARVDANYHRPSAYPAFIGKK